MKQEVKNHSALVQQVSDLACEPVAAAGSASPDLVQEWAKDRILALIQSAHSVAKIAIGEVPRLADGADDCHRFVLAVFALGHQHRQSEIGARLERERESLVVA